MDLKNMKMDAEEAKEYSQPTAMGGQAEYPYGLRIRLDDSSLAKLGMSSLPAVGSEIAIMAKAKVCCVSSNDVDGESESSVELQITDMDVSSGTKKQDPAKALYGDESEA